MQKVNIDKITSEYVYTTWNMEDSQWNLWTHAWKERYILLKFNIKNTCILGPFGVGEWNWTMIYSMNLSTNFSVPYNNIL